MWTCLRFLAGNARRRRRHPTRAGGHKPGERIGQAVIVDSRAGAGGMIVMNAAMQDLPSGCTLLVFAGCQPARVQAQRKRALACARAAHPLRS